MRTLAASFRDPFAALLGGVAFVALALTGGEAAAQTRAATRIINVAEAHYTIADADHVARSGEAMLRVDEIIAVALLPADAQRDAGAFAFSLVNKGNGNEAFRLDATIANGVVRGFAIDVNGDGLYQPGVDTLLDGGVSPQLAPGAQLRLLALFDEVQPGTALTITARSATIEGPAGTVAPGRGDEGVNAILGIASADASLTFTLGAASAPADVTLEKSQSVASADGRGSAVRGATITYSLVARVAAGASARDAVLRDPIPEGTAYVPGSLTVDGATLTDLADGDAGSVEDGAVRVALGLLRGGTARDIQFKVTIQ